jgi:hypothetical protein
MTLRAMDVPDSRLGALPVTTARQTVPMPQEPSSDSTR